MAESTKARVGGIVSTVEQLDALPWGTVIVRAGQYAESTGPVVWQKWSFRDVGERWVSVSYVSSPSRSLIGPNGPGPYLVVWQPERGGAEPPAPTEEEAS